jgi:GGDEF domain-containing protein
MSLDSLSATCTQIVTCLRYFRSIAGKPVILQHHRGAALRISPCDGFEGHVETQGIRPQALDRHELDKLECREIELSRLATSFVLILGVALAVFMYMYVFLLFRGKNWTLNVAFVGFCLLTVLFVSYLQLHQRSVRKLKQKLVAELERNAQLRFGPSPDLLQSMPDLAQFRERVAMEFPRALAAQTGLSVMLIEIGSEVSVKGAEVSAVILDGVKALSGCLRPMDSVYRLSPNVFGLVLPGTDTASAGRVGARLNRELERVRTRHLTEIALATHNYPEVVRTAQEFQDVIDLSLVKGVNADLPVCVAVN